MNNELMDAKMTGIEEEEEADGRQQCVQLRWRSLRVASLSKLWIVQ